MNSSIALRLLWKEYRVQRGLWLSMAGGCIALQALIAYLVPSDQESFQGIVPIAFMLTGFYAIGSGAITFAIEREDGTQLRPVMLGCPPGLTLTIKTVFGILTTALLLAVTFSSGMLMTLGSLALPENTFQPDVQGMIVPLALLFVALPYLGCLLWSTFFSLITRKVIVALGLAAVAMIVSYVIVAATSITIFESGQRPYPRQLDAPGLFLAALVPCFLALLLLALNYLLTHRWLTRAFFDQTASKSPSFFKRWRIRRSGLDGGMVVEIGVEDRTAFDVVSPDVAAHQPPPRFGLSLLYAMWGPNLWRHLRFLRWKEAIETRKIYVGFLGAALMLTLWGVIENMASSDWQVVPGFFIHAACVACGAMAFRAEQDERKVQRLADMGLRPATVWLSKHLVWLTRAVVSIFAILACVCFVRLLYPEHDSRMGFEQFFYGTWLTTQFPNTMPNYDPGLRLIGRAFILTLTMYGIGQACSQLIRSTVVSMFVAFVLALTGFGWSVTSAVFDVPLTLSVLPLAIGCLLLTWSRTDSWMKDDNRPKAWIWPVTSLATAIAILCLGTGLFRVYEIPWSKPFFSDGTSAEFDDGLTDEQREFVLAPLTEQETSTFAMYQRAVELTGKLSFRLRLEEQTAQEMWTQLSQEDQKSAEQAVDLVLEASSQAECAELSPVDSNIVDVATSRAPGTFLNSIELVLFAAQREIEKGNLDVALNHYRSCLAVARHAASRGFQENWSLSYHQTVFVLRAIQAWARHPEVDDVLIAKAIAIIDEHRTLMMPLEIANFATAVAIRNTLDADAFTISELVDDGEKRFVMFLAAKFPGERSRSQRLLNAREAADLRSISSYRSHQIAANTDDGFGMRRWYQSRDLDALKRNKGLWYSIQSTPLFSLIASMSARDWLCQQDIQTECVTRATKVIVQLLQQQRETDELPESLDGFDESLNDPWTDQSFIWYPKGLPGNLIQGSNVLVEANSPFLMTMGKEEVTLRRVEYLKEDSFYPDMARESDMPVGSKETLQDGVLRVEYRAETGNRIPSPGIRVWILPKTVESAVRVTD